jgi:hypothetical protein
MWRPASYVLALLLAWMPGHVLADPWAHESPDLDRWTVTVDPDVALRAGPNTSWQRLELMRAGTPLRIIGSDGDWAQVLAPRANTTGYVRRDLLQLADAPSPFAFEQSPPLDAEFSTVVVASTDMPLYYYPADDPLAEAMPLPAGDRETVTGAVTGQDGASWFVTSDGYFLRPSDALFVGSAASEFGSRWLDVSLTGAAHVVAYDGGVPVRSFYAIKGTARFPTPLGVWSITRRVANETMDSTTVGIPRFSPGGYYLQNVLYTQYFGATGESLHYNWWSSAWGAPGSHGCLGLSLTDSRWLWDWAAIGTPVLIHP